MIGKYYMIWKISIAVLDTCNKVHVLFLTNFFLLTVAPEDIIGHTFSKYIFERYVFSDLPISFVTKQIPVTSNQISL